jgi:cyclophilin family peptidyl-prolyl cis-trans isomerase
VPSDKRQRQREGRVARQEELRLAQQHAKRNRQFVIFGIVVVLLGVVYYFVAVRSSGSKTVATGTTTTTAAGTSTSVAGASTTVVTAPPVSVPLLTAPAGTVGCPAADGSSPHYTKFTITAPPNCLVGGKSYTAKLVTDVGTITIALDGAAAPKAVNNFYFLAGYHFFDGTAFHRVIPGFVDQGGDPTGTGTGGPGYSFADELPKAGAYKAGSFAMANSGANTNGSQFFIVAADAGGAQLQPNYTLFGQVTGGMDIVTKINNDGDASGTPKVVHKIVTATVAAS